MTEKRKQELAEEYQGKLFPDSHPARLLVLDRLIGTVAAESQQEGIDEMRDALLKSWGQKEGAIYEVIKEAAARLKEQGK